MCIKLVGILKEVIDEMSDLSTLAERTAPAVINLKEVIDEMNDLSEPKVSSFRKLKLRCIPTTPSIISNGDSDSEFFEIDSEKMMILVIKTENHDAFRNGEALQGMSNAVETITGKPTMAVLLSPGEEFEIWEEE